MTGKGALLSLTATNIDFLQCHYSFINPVSLRLIKLFS